MPLHALHCGGRSTCVQVPIAFVVNADFLGKTLESIGCCMLLLHATVVRRCCCMELLLHATVTCCCSMLLLHVTWCCFESCHALCLPRLYTCIAAAIVVLAYCSGESRTSVARQCCSLLIHNEGGVQGGVNAPPHRFHLPAHHLSGRQPHRQHAGVSWPQAPTGFPSRCH